MNVEWKHFFLTLARIAMMVVFFQAIGVHGGWRSFFAVIGLLWFVDLSITIRSITWRETTR